MKQWLWWASQSRLQPFEKFARTIREHLDGILAWTQLRVSNGALEGMDNPSRPRLPHHRDLNIPLE